MAKYFLNSKISAYGEANGYVDLAALAANFPHISCREAEFIKYEMELKNGSEYYYYDNDGKEYSESERDSKVEEIQEKLEELEDKKYKYEAMLEESQSQHRIDRLEKLIETLDDSIYELNDELYTLEQPEEHTIFRFEIIDRSGCEMLSEYTDEIVYYIPDLDVYLWGITHCNIGWTEVLTPIPIP